MNRKQLISVSTLGTIGIGGFSPSLMAGKQKKGSRKMRKGGAEMVFVPGGTFGPDDGMIANIGYKAPVTLPSFWMDATPVTVKQYRFFCEATNRKMPDPLRLTWDGYDDHPIVNVSWYDAKAYADWANCELPTTTQFEYAARDGGKKIACAWSTAKSFPIPEADCDRYTWCSIKTPRNMTASVKRKNNIFVNSLGLSDISGNVWEWCKNLQYNSNCLMGGSWFDTSILALRCSNVHLTSAKGDSSFGFRLVSRI